MLKLNFTAFITVAAFLAGGSTTAFAQQGLITQKAISLDMAMTMAQASLAKCRSLGYKCGITVLDVDGLVKITLVDDGANLHRMDVSRKKAYTALVYKRPSLEVVKGWSNKAKDPVPLVEGTIPSPPIEGTIAMGGGLPIKVGNDVIGAISVSGAPGWEMDEACSAAGIAAVADKLK
jgi:uncharacterized protein GlcG (DUF336 family)